MNQIYLKLREEARNIVATLPLPKFYQQFNQEIAYSRQMLYSHPMLVKIKHEINPMIEDDFGHGMRHSDLVCVDAGAIIQIEMRENIAIKKKPENNINNIVENNVKNTIENPAKNPVTNNPTTNPATNNIINSCQIINQILLVQVAGLLHDIKRKEKKHSAQGAKFARTFLSTGKYPLTIDEIDIICSAISQHEAFQKESVDMKECVDMKETTKNPKNLIVSNALYDADKFRWGTDNFTHTLWDMVIFSNVPLPEFVRRYPDGMTILEQIKGTFRTNTGKFYGPDFINLGIETGNQLFKIIQKLKLLN